jgi:hypothetical protein
MLKVFGLIKKNGYVVKSEVSIDVKIERRDCRPCFVATLEFVCLTRGDSVFVTSFKDVSDPFKNGTCTKCGFSLFHCFKAVSMRFYRI